MNVAHFPLLAPRSWLSIGLRFTLFLTAFSTMANDSSVYFTHKAWDLVCDNTLTCRAAGYSPESIAFGVSVLLTRKAGAATPVDNQVMLSDGVGDDTVLAARGTPQLFIDGHALGALQVADEQNSIWRMDATQYAALLSALRRDRPIIFKDKLADYPLSGSGSSAVLLRMDDVQGRIDTPGAIFRKGTKNESGVKAPIAAPVIVRAPIRDKEAREMNAQETARFKPLLMKTLTGDNKVDCTDDQINSDHSPWRIARLNETHSLIVAPCWQAAYNWGSLFWLVDNDMKQPALPVADRATDYQNGSIALTMRGRGLGDCWSTEAWEWDGVTFVHSAESWTGRCRYIRNGGAWDMPTWVSTVQ